MSAELLIQTDIIKFFKEFLNSPVFRTASVVILLILIILVIIIIKSIISRILSAYKEIKTENSRKISVMNIILIAALLILMLIIIIPVIIILSSFIS
ncbi:MAG TPA: hypothetical protein DIW26_07610 [Ruminococcus sp.]|nr:hypothetical protein [Ruminococcus sp.]